MKLFDKTWKLAVSGAVIGLLVMLLAIYGNPANMAICVACFIRDTAGALKLHTAAPVQYFRPEVVGFVCGSFLLALLTREYKSTAGSSPMVRFILGAAMMIGALVFLGCPLRMVLRMAAGDLNAWVALIGFAGGAATGSFFLKKGFSLGRAYEAKPVGGAVLPVLLAMDAMQDYPGKLIRVLGDEAHTRKNIEKMLEYENKSGQTTVRPDGCFEIVFQA